MRIPENKIEEIRSAANIVDIISEYVPLRKRGRNFLGLCPFHSEKTPSFTVNEEKQIYHCFGCHAGGNVYKFLMEYEKISFIEAVQDLAKRTGITLEFDENINEEKQSEQEILYDINTLAARYFSDNLLNSTEGETGREYFNKRKIKPQTLRAFGLGYSLNGWENFIEFAKDKKIDLEKAVLLGLIGRNKDGRLFDKFSGRIIFPIFSPNGRVIAFAGRILENREGTAKYLNSPESLIYTKGKILYGLSFAKDEIRRQDKAILVEGYMDLISLYQNGIKNVVAVSGTALTEDQVLLLSRYTKNIVLLFDADTAGIKASMRSIELLLKRDIEIKIVSLPSGEDPDSYVHNYGKEKFEELIRYAQNFMEYQSAYYESLGMFEDPAKTSEAIRDLVKPAALINDELKRALLIKSIAKKFNLREKLLEKELDTALQQTKRQEKLETERKLKDEAKIDSAAKNKPVPEHIFLLEKDMIKVMLEDNPETASLILDNVIEEEFVFQFHKLILSVIKNLYNSGKEITANNLLSEINDVVVQNYIRDLILEKYSVSKKFEDLYPGPSKKEILLKETRDMVNKFKVLKLLMELKSNESYLKNTDNLEEEETIMHNIREIHNEIKTISKDYNFNNVNLGLSLS
ncbi:MAG: DNA primase [Ignavibacteriaceae bacterium]